MSAIPMPSIWQLATLWGPGILILAGVFVIVYFLMPKLLDRYLDQKRAEQTVMLELLKAYADSFVAAQKQQADAMSDLALCFRERAERDATEHSEIILHLKVLTQMVKDRIGGAND